MKKAFTLIELLIVVIILGILATVVVPKLQGHIQLSRETTAKNNLRILRSTIELFAVQHNNIPPGYTPGTSAVLFNEFITQTYLLRLKIIQGGYNGYSWYYTTS